MKYYILLALLVGQTVAAPLSGGVSANGSPSGLSGTWNFNGQNANVDVQTKVKGFTAFLLLLAPDSWVNAWNQIPEEGKECFLNTASDPANAAIYNSDDNEKIKNDLKSKCASSSTQLSSFCDQTEATMKQLPTSFTDISKTWGQQMQDLGNQYKSAGTNAGTQSLADAKNMITQFAKPTGDYLNKLSALSQEDRQKISDAFPKLQPFFSGDHSVEFLKEITQLYQTMGSGNFNADSLKDPAKNLVTTWGSLWTEYKTINADGLKKASDLLGKDLTQAGDQFAAQLAAKTNGTPINSLNGGSFPSAGSASGSLSASANGPLGSGSFANKFAANNPELANEIHKRVEEGKVKFDEAKDKIQGAFHDASDSGKAKLEDAKNAAQQKWSEFKGQAGNGASADVKAN